MRATKTAKHITFSPAAMARLEERSRATKVSISEITDGCVLQVLAGETPAGATLADLYQEVLDLRADLLSFRSKVLPLVETVTALLQQMEGDLPKAERVHEPRPKIATYEEMYGPITHTPSPEPTQPPVDPPPRRRWPWSS